MGLDLEKKYFSLKFYLEKLKKNKKWWVYSFKYVTQSPQATLIQNCFKLSENWKLQQGAKRRHGNWDFMSKTDVQSNTEFSQTYCACLQKRGFVRQQIATKKTCNIKKEKRNPMYLCDRKMTTKPVFNIFILGLNKKKKQN